MKKYVQAQTKYRQASFAVLALLLAGLTLVASLWASDSAAQGRWKRYELRGVVKSVEKARKRATIQHEKVGDYMDAMTMPFFIKDEKALNEMKPEDQIKGLLVVTDDGRQWLERITIITASQR